MIALANCPIRSKNSTGWQPFVIFHVDGMGWDWDWDGYDNGK